MIGVVIPALNEEQALSPLLADLQGLARELPVDIVVADGGSEDQTRARAAAAGARVVGAPRGRAVQLNAGAAAARGEWLLFLHADSRLNPACKAALAAAVVDPHLQAAVFRFAIDLPRGWKQFIEWGQVARQALFRLPYGDQGLLVRRSRFQAVGGYPAIPVMEDVALVRRLRSLGPVATLPATLVTSGRRYRARGVVRTWLLHTALVSLYAAGVAPRRLAAWRDG
jgi:rSAM/selenodomain-associated transferase 2